MDLQITKTVVNHQRKNPVFVIGNTRSGTTMLVRLLRKYFHINYGPESQFIIRYNKTLSAYGDLSKDKNFYRLVKDISKERFFKRARKNFDFTLDIDRIMAADKERTYPALLSHIFEQFAEQQNMKKWGDKTPAYLHDLPALDQLFPDAQYIHIVRDGRDVALSQFNIHFGPKNVYRAAKEWKAAVKKIQNFKAVTDHSKFIEFRYEDVLENPIPVFEKLIPFLQIDDKNNRVIESIREKINSDLRKGNFYKWKKQFSEYQKKIFEKEATDILRSYDYSVIYGNLSPVSVPEKLFWEMEHVFKKSLRRDSWKDNFYRLGIKWKQFFRAIGK